MADPRYGTIDTRLAFLEGYIAQLDTDHDALGDLIADTSGLLENKRSLAAVSAAGPITRGITVVTTGNADKAMTLPSVAMIDAGYDYVVIKVDAAGSGKIVLTPNGTDTIGGAATLTSAASALASAHIVSDGVSNWTVLGTSGTWS